MNSCKKQLEDFDEIVGSVLKTIFITIALLGLVLSYIVINYTPTVTNTEYFEENNCSVTKTYCLKGVSYVNVYSECGDYSVQNEEYYRYYKDKIGESVIASFEKTSFSDGSVHLKIYKITDNE